MAGLLAVLEVPCLFLWWHDDGWMSLVDRVSFGDGGSLSPMIFGFLFLVLVVMCGGNDSLGMIGVVVSCSVVHSHFHPVGILLILFCL